MRNSVQVQRIHRRKVQHLEKLFFRMILGISVTILILFVAAIHSRSQEINNIRIQENYYQNMETEYKAQVRECLRSEGYPDSGVTLTKIFTEGGTRDYTVTIHHKLINKMAESGKKELGDKLLQIDFPVPNCTFACVFLDPAE